MKITLETSGLRAAGSLLDAFSDRRLAASVATALTRTAVAARGRALRDLDSSIIGGPTPYTRRQLRYIGATAARLEAAVGFDIAAITDIRGNVQRYASVGDTPASKYMLPQVEGGGRHIKRFERALQAAGAMPAGWQSVPADGAKLDAYGNISRGQIVQILSQVGTELTAGYRRSLPRLRGGETAREKRSVLNKRRRAFGRAGGQYVAIPRPKGKLRPGIYLAQARDFGARWGLGRTGKLIPVLWFVKTTSYRPRYDFYGTVRGAVDELLGAELNRAFSEQAQRLSLA